MTESPTKRSRLGPILFGAILCVVLFVALLLLSKREKSFPPVAIQGPGAGRKGTPILPKPGGRAPGAPMSPAGLPLRKEVILRYGSGEGELGMIHRTEQEPLGPESFAIGQNGEIYVADGVNRRVVIYGKDGDYAGSVALPDAVPGDVIGSSTGGLLIYDPTRCALLSYDPNGNLQSTLPLNPKDIDTRGYFHAVGSSIYFADAGVRDVLVGTAQEDGLHAPEGVAQRVSEGIHTGNGNLFSVAIERGAAVHLTQHRPAGQRSIECPLPGVVSARFAGEDQSGGFYVQTERLDGADIVLEVVAFGPSGERLSVTRMPENDYFVWTTKLVDVRRDGTIVQFLPQRGQAKLNMFGSQSSSQ